MTPDSEIIQNILDNQVKFYFNKESDSDVYVEFEGPNGAICFEPCDSELFQSFLRIEYRSQTDGQICTDFNDFIQAACDDAIWAGKPQKVSICHRVDGALGKKIVYSLANDERQCVVVIPGKWTVLPGSKLPKIRFLKDKSTLPQAIPSRDGDYLKLLEPYINLDRDSFLLLAVWMIQCLSKTSSHFALLISGGQGTGKSTLTELIQDLVDPAVTSKTIMPNTERDLKVQLSNSYMVCYDNTRPLTNKFSDILCSSITGGTVVLRQLYTTNSQVSLPLHNIIVLNGISIIPEQSDLAERCLLFELPKISTTHRQTDNDFKARFKKDKPAILGAMFTALCRAMEILPTLQMGQLHRMSDAHRGMTAIAVALGIDQAEFDRIFWNNVNRLKMANISSDPFVAAMVNYLQHRPKDTTMTMSGLFDAMRNDFVNRSCGAHLACLPKNASHLSRKLSQVETSLKAAGYMLHFDYKADATYITIKRKASKRLTKKQKETTERQAALMADDDAATEE